MAINLDGFANQIWVTPNIAGTSGFGGGPLWNNSVSSSPEVPGSGAAMTGATGSRFWLSGELYYPAFASLTSDAGTFSFASNATLESKIGAGQTTVYQNWDVGTGGPPTPGPLSPQNFVVANAPPWSATTSVSAGARVVAGPGHTPGGGFTNGADLFVWGLSGAGGTTSGSQPAGFATCASPANVGGGLDGTPPAGWSGKTSVSDNGLTWVCLAKVDYVTASDVFGDDIPWTPNTEYYQLSYTVNGNNIYIQPGGGDFDCVSASSGGPTGTGSGIVDGTCHWNYYKTLTYTSGVAPWTHQQIPTVAQEVITFSYYPIITFYHGGSGRQVYQGGQNGETDPIPFQLHQDWIGDAQPACRHAGGLVLMYACNGTISGSDLQGAWAWTIQAAPGDSIGENVTGTAGPLRLDASKGVTFYSNSALTGCTGPALGYSDTAGFTKGLQFHSTQSYTVSSHGYGCGGQHTNSGIVSNSIFQSDTGPGVINTDGGWVFNNVIIIYGGSTANATGIISAYETFYQNVTFLGSGSSGSTAIVQQGSTGVVFETLHNVNVFGWTNPLAMQTSTANTAIGANNATDISAGYTGSTYTTAAPFAISVDSYQLPGVGTTCSGGAGACSSLSAANQFKNSTIGGSLDLRVKSTSADIYGAGASSSTAAWSGSTTNVLDFFGTTRGPRYDIGAEQFVP